MKRFKGIARHAVVRGATVGSFLVGVAVGFASAATSQPMPNIVVIFADDLGYGDLQCYNPEKPIPTPHLDQMAREGCRYTQAYAPSSVCSPTRYGLLTGQYPWRGPLKNGVVMEYEPPIVDPSIITLPERLKTAGYKTACIGKWHLGIDWPTRDGKPLLSKYGQRPTFDQFKLLAADIDYDGKVRGGPVDHGFDYYYGEDVINFPPYMFVENDRFANPPDRLRDKKKELSGQPGMMDADWTDASVFPKQVAKVLAYLDLQAANPNEGPFFLYWTANAVHYPICPSSEYVKKTQHGIYGDFVHELDDGVGKVLQRLKDRHLDNTTLVIFTSDNGPRSDKLPSGHTSTAGLRGMKSTGWDGGLKVPFIACWPQVVPSNSVSDTVISLVDLYPTLSALAGVQCGDQLADGMNIIQALKTGSLDGGAARAIVMASVDGGFSLRLGDWSYVDHPGSGSHKCTDDEENSPQQLYNLQSDAGQRNNLIAKYPEKASELKREMERIKKLPARPSR